MEWLAAGDYQRIIARRDRRFDGRFYFGVKTTRVYCRPVCPAKPKPENILIFRSLSEAERTGFRPCLRCRPEAAPGHGLKGEADILSRALRVLNERPEDELTVESLAASLGVTDRHLRRLFDAHLGASPIEVMITQRLHFAKQAIQQTAQPITEIAFASGFQSIRRFNEAFKARFHSSPSEFRVRQAGAAADSFEWKLPIHSPYDWATVLAYLKRHETYGVESIEGNAYRRFVPRRNSFGTLAVAWTPGRDFLHVRFTDIPLLEARPLLARLKRLFDTDHNPIHLPAGKGVIARGIRVPGSFDPFETAVSIILSQLVSTEQAKSKLQALVRRFGRKLGDHGTAEVYRFPAPAVLAEAPVEKIGIPKARADAVRGLARAVQGGALNFGAAVEFSRMEERLTAIRGIGPWTAAMIAMRCLGDPDAFPASDLIVQRVIENKLVDHRPWASSKAYLTHCLWRDYGRTLSNKRRIP